MSVFVDTGVFYTHHDEDSTRHASASRTMRKLASGEFGTPTTSDYVLDETVTLVFSRTGRHDDALTVGQRILGRGGYPSVVDITYVGRETVREAFDVFERYDDQQLSFTDATAIALIEHLDIERMLSYDDDFDGMVDRLDPATI